MWTTLAASILCFGLASAAPTGTGQETPLQTANRVLESNPVVDGHNDFPYFLRNTASSQLDSGIDFTANLTDKAHTDLDRLRKGKVGGQFWSAFMPCATQYKDATSLFQEQTDLIKRFVDRYSDNMTFVRTSAELKAAFDQKKIGSMIGVESGHAISSSLAVLRSFYELGARYMTLTHSCNTPWADAAQVEDGELPVRSNGLSLFGKDVVREMNRLGLMVDLSHVSTKVMSDALDVTTAPVIFSHSSARSIFNHSRNVPDEILKRVSTNGGIVMVNFYSCYVVANCSNDPGTVDDVAKHVDRIKQVAGVNNVGIGGDYDGVPTLPAGLEDVSKYPNLFAHLVEKYGWTEEELAKLASGNLLRVWDAVESRSKTLQSVTDPRENWIPFSDFKESETGCMTRKQ